MASITIAILLCAACTEQLAPAPILPTATPPATIAAEQSPADLARGQQVFYDKQCSVCHNPAASGGIGPALAGTTLSFDQFLHVLRTAIAPKPAFSEAELSTQDAHNVYGWLQSLPRAGSTRATPTPHLAPGQVLGMTLWVQGKCDTCHGAFAQGSPNGPPLAGINPGLPAERDHMRLSADMIPAHATDNIDDATFQRLYQWLKEGADPNNGC